MTDRGKTIICSVLFLDIVEYSRKSVSGQISLKERFNAYLSVAIRDVPIDDRIILDTGDGAALSFLGDVGDALQVALSMRESLREGLHMEPPLLVRMGINLGPVRLIRDINGQPNIVGDGINVAQRVMGFADPGQILVSRTYYDAVSRLSPEYAGMFHYQGSRTDKHVREHEIYAIGYPGEFTSTLTLSGEGGRSKSELSGLSRTLGRSWRSVLAAIREASLAKRIGYGAAVLLSVAAIVAGLAVALRRPPEPPILPGGGQPPSVAVVPASSVTAAVSGPAATVPPAPARTPEREKASRKARERAVRESKQQERAKHKPNPTVIERLLPRAKPSAGQTTLTVACSSGAAVYVDGQSKGTVGKGALVITLDAGRHLVLVMYSSRVYSKSLDFPSGKQVRISPDICH
jgi:Adenylate and Guanylate cyclase catalytic domain